MTHLVNAEGTRVVKLDLQTAGTMSLEYSMFTFNRACDPVVVGYVLLPSSFLLGLGPNLHMNNPVDRTPVFGNIQMVISFSTSPLCMQMGRLDCEEHNI